MHTERPNWTVITHCPQAQCLLSAVQVECRFECRQVSAGFALEGYRLKGSRGHVSNLLGFVEHGYGVLVSQRD
jgi:hypothetical protein